MNNSFSKIRYFLEKFSGKKHRIGISPYISGDLFLSVADAALLRGSSELISLRTRRKILFVESELIESRRSLEIASTFQKVLVHNGDHSISSNAQNFLRANNCEVFATGIFNNHTDQLHSLPQGIENAHHCKNGDSIYYSPLNFATLDLEKKRNLLVSFSIRTNPTERGRIANLTARYGYQNRRLTISNYRKLLRESRFVISPPGNCIDTHRCWEACYHKTIPIIERKFFLFSGHDLPFLIVDDLAEFLSLSIKQQTALYEKIMTRNYDAIYFDYWLNLISTDTKK